MIIMMPGKTLKKKSHDDSEAARTRTQARRIWSRFKFKFKPEFEIGGKAHSPKTKVPSPTSKLASPGRTRGSETRSKLEVQSPFGAPPRPGLTTQDTLQRPKTVTVAPRRGGRLVRVTVTVLQVQSCTGTGSRLPGLTSLGQGGKHTLLRPKT